MKQQGKSTSTYRVRPIGCSAQSEAEIGKEKERIGKIILSETSKATVEKSK